MRFFKHYHSSLSMRRLRACHFQMTTSFTQGSCSVTLHTVSQKTEPTTYCVSKNRANFGKLWFRQAWADFDNSGYSNITLSKLICTFNFNSSVLLTLFVLIAATEITRNIRRFPR